MIQWHIKLFLLILDFQVLSLRSGQSDKVRWGMAMRFNNLNEKIDTMITIYHASKINLNLHLCCADGVFMKPAPSINTMLQAIDRIHHLGQTR